VTFGFVDRSGHSAGLRGARFQAVSARSRSAEIGWNLWGMLPHLLPHGGAPSHASIEGQASSLASTPSSSIRATIRSRVAGNSEATTSQTRLRSTPR
jgi:hypothetical protein